MVTEPKRASWDVGRLIKTLTYFEIIPFLACLGRLFAAKNEQKQRQMGGKNMGIILVAGATGGVGKRVVKRLLDRNYRVRALVRDIQKAKEILGTKVELFESDITIPETLTAALMDKVSAIICCTGTRVQPVAGDSPNREKYYQGIKFYLPEVVDIPEIVEYQGIKNLMQSAVDSKSLKAGEKLLFDFHNPPEDVKEIWGAVDDVVMGGVSQSSFRVTAKNAVFTGNVSIANNGGFASVRTKNLNPPWDLSDYQGLELRVKGDGKRYKFITRCEGKWDGIGYCYSFDTVYDFWTTIRIPFADLIPVFRAKTVKDAGTFDRRQVYSLQLMLSKFEYDGHLNPQFEPGIFSLEIEYIKAYGGTAIPQFIMISSAGVTRPGRLDINLEEEPPAVKMNAQLGNILTWKLRGEDVVRKSGLTYTIIRPCALTEEPGDKVLVCDQGDHLKGKISRESIAELCLQILEQSQACQKTFEVKETAEVGTNDWQNMLTKLELDT